MCDSAPSYLPKTRSSKTQSWQKVSDKTGRGYESESSQLPGSVSNVNQKAPRPTMETITKQNMPDLDHNNRFFDDNLRLAHKFGPGYLTVEKQPEAVKPVEQVSCDETKKVDESC